MSSARHELSEETRRRIAAILDTAQQPIYWHGAWDTGNGDVSAYVERDLAIERAERRAQKGKD